ncbi:MAG: hypothetical protein V3T77_04695, partial [Planctomycetota bacterium]
MWSYDRSPKILVTLAVLLWCPVSAPTAAQEKAALSFEDLMKFRQMRQAVISEDGEWVAYRTVPDRGDSEVWVHRISGELVLRAERGSGPVFSSDAAWVAMKILPPQAKLEKIKDKKKQPKEDLLLIHCTTSEAKRFHRIMSFAFSEDGRWLVYHHHPEKAEEKEQKDEPESGSEPAEKEKEQPEKDRAKPPETGWLVLRELATGHETKLPEVEKFALDPQSRFLAWIRFS